MSDEQTSQAMRSDAPLMAAVRQRDAGHEAAEARSWPHAALTEMIGGAGPDAVIGAVGRESHGFAIDSAPGAVRTATRMEKGLQVRGGRTHVQKYLRPLLEMIGEGRIDTTWLISRRPPIEDAPKDYKMFKERGEEVTKVALKPEWQKEAA